MTATATFAVCVGAVLSGCAVPPWSMGRPLDGKPSIPPTTASPSVTESRLRARAERAAAHPALELRALLAIDGAQRLAAEERARLVVLLEQRATELLALGRAVRACADLRRIEELAPARAPALGNVHAQAERDAGDVWLGVGDRRRARDAYEVAAALGADAMDFRLAAASDAPLAQLPRAALERAVLELPLRAVPAFAEAYIGPSKGGSDGGGDGADHDGRAANRAALERAGRAAHQEKKRALAARIDARLTTASTGAPPASAPGPAAGAPPDTAAEGGAIDALLDAPAAPSASRAPAAGTGLDDWAVGAASVSIRLVPALQQRRELLAPGARSRAWADLLLDEDPTSPEVLALSATIDGFAGRIGGAERKLTDLVYFSPDRYQGMVRAAAVWDSVGQTRLACVSWLRAARWSDEPDDPAWPRAVACTRLDPGAGDWRAIVAYVVARAPAERRAAAAAALDPLAAAAAPPGAPPAPISDRPAGDPIPCDTGGSPR